MQTLRVSRATEADLFTSKLQHSIKNGTSRCLFIGLPATHKSNVANLRMRRRVEVIATVVRRRPQLLHDNFLDL
jgi:hypothetical protein